jgi:hypothetical protein
MPMSPAVVGPPLLMFDSALGLFEYIHNFMPWHDRGSMTEMESWSVTAYILDINDIDPGPELNRESAARITLRGTTDAVGVASAPAAAPELESAESAPVPAFWTAAIIVVLAMAVLGILFVRRRSRG